MSRENGRAIAIGNSLNFRLDVFVGDDGEFGLEGTAVGGAGELEAAEVLGVGVASENLRQDFLLNMIGVSSHFLDELKGFRVFLARRGT